MAMPILCLSLWQVDDKAHITKKCVAQFPKIEIDRCDCFGHSNIEEYVKQALNGYVMIHNELGFYPYDLLPYRYEHVHEKYNCVVVALRENEKEDPKWKLTCWRNSDATWIMFLNLAEEQQEIQMQDIPASVQVFLSRV
jgi:hypothetical protein